MCAKRSGERCHFATVARPLHAAHAGIEAAKCCTMDISLLGDFVRPLYESLLNARRVDGDAVVALLGARINRSEYHISNLLLLGAGTNMRAAGSSAVGSTLQPSAQLCCFRRHLHSGSAPLCHHLLAYRGAGLLHAPSLRSWAVQPGPGVRCCAASGPSPFGTTGPAPVRRQHKPEWVRCVSCGCVG